MNQPALVTAPHVPVLVNASGARAQIPRGRCPGHRPRHGHVDGDAAPPGERLRHDPQAGGADITTKIGKTKPLT